MSPSHQRRLLKCAAANRYATANASQFAALNRHTGRGKQSRYITFILQSCPFHCASSVLRANQALRVRKMNVMQNSYPSQVGAKAWGYLALRGGGVAVRLSLPRQKRRGRWLRSQWTVKPDNGVSPAPTRAVSQRLTFPLCRFLQPERFRRMVQNQPV